MRTLIRAWVSAMRPPMFCECGDFEALGLILPAYLADLGTQDDRVRLRSGKTDAIDAAAAAQAVLSGRATATAKTSVGRHQARWNLAADSTELATLDDLAGACPEQTVTYEPAG